LPSEVDAAANTIAVTTGANHTCALLVTNDLNCWVGIPLDNWVTRLAVI
jgi:hypothetical protein